MAFSKSLITAVIGAFVSLTVCGAAPARAQASDPYLGQLMLVGNFYCPRGWTEAAGQTLAISQNSALFALYGTTFGGDGVTTFMLPNLQGRTVIGQGVGAGLSPRVMGQTGGVEQVGLTSQQMPAHTHQAQSTLNATESDAGTGNPAGALLSSSSAKIYAAGGNPDSALSGSSVTTVVGPSGGSQPLGIMNPFLAMRWCVALQGIFPPRP